MPGAKRILGGVEAVVGAGRVVVTCRYQWTITRASLVISTMFPDVPLVSVRRKVTRASVVAINGINFAPMTSLPSCAAAIPSRTTEVVRVRDLADHGEGDPAVGRPSARLLGTGGCGERVHAGGERDDKRMRARRAGCVTPPRVLSASLDRYATVAGLPARGCRMVAPPGYVGHYSSRRPYGSRSFNKRSRHGRFRSTNGDQLQAVEMGSRFRRRRARPARPEWDEREETPWPIIEEAAKIGLPLDGFHRQRVGDPTA